MHFENRLHVRHASCISTKIHIYTAPSADADAGHSVHEGRRVPDAAQGAAPAAAVLRGGQGVAGPGVQAAAAQEEGLEEVLTTVAHAKVGDRQSEQSADSAITHGTRRGGTPTHAHTNAQKHHFFVPS